MTLTMVDALLERRTEANTRFFAAEAGRIALLCRELAERFLAGGRLLAVGDSPQAWSDARHVAVEFVHPVIVGKRALPALAVAREELDALLGEHDAVIEFEPLVIRLCGSEPQTSERRGAGGDEARLAGSRVSGSEPQTRFEPPSDDPFVRQELCETLYHVVWELVHVFFDHLGGSSAGAGASSFLYPFLERGAPALDEVVEDVRRSVLLKAEEVAALRTQTLEAAREELAAAAATVRDALDAGGAVLAFGNGGSATDAMDLVADLRAAPQAWPHRRALDLTADPAILTALANDIGGEVLFQRQVIAYGRPGDVVVALSTSGNSANVVAALAEARSRGLTTVAFVGYDGGRVASEQLADHVVVSRSEHIPRIQEAQASAYHVLRELIER